MKEFKQFLVRLILSLRLVVIECNQRIEDISSFIQLKLQVFAYILSPCSKSKIQDYAETLLNWKPNPLTISNILLFNDQALEEERNEIRLRAQALSSAYTWRCNCLNQVLCWGSKATTFPNPKTTYWSLCP